MISQTRIRQILLWPLLREPLLSLPVYFLLFLTSDSSIADIVVNNIVIYFIPNLLLFVNTS